MQCGYTGQKGKREWDSQMSPCYQNRTWGQHSLIPAGIFCLLFSGCGCPGVTESVESEGTDKAGLLYHLNVGEPEVDLFSQHFRYIVERFFLLFT